MNNTTPGGIATMPPDNIIFASSSGYSAWDPRGWFGGPSMTTNGTSTDNSGAPSEDPATPQSGSVDITPFAVVAVAVAAIIVVLAIKF